MNILMVLSQLEVTGAEVYACETADYLTDREHRVFILSDTLTKKTKAVYTPLPFNKRSIPRRLIHVFKVYRFIKKNRIDVVHAHSRASGWVAYFACKTSRVPLVTTVHGLQHTRSPTRKLITAFGDYVLPVCENIGDQLKNIFKISAEKVEVLRNGIRLSGEAQHSASRERKTIVVIGRLSGPKGDVTYELLKNVLVEFTDCNVVIVGGKTIPERFRGFEKFARFTGYVPNVSDYIVSASVVIGAGRVAAEALMRGKPVMALGEAGAVGLVTTENIREALASNFGDIDPEGSFPWARLKVDLRNALDAPSIPESLSNFISEQFSLEKVGNRLEQIYTSLCSDHKKR